MHVKFRFAIFLLLLCVGSLASAQNVSPKALLWRIEAPGVATPSYLFGTIHLIEAKDFLISDSLMTALNRAEQVYFEIDPAEMTDMGMQMQLMMKATMRGDTTLSDLLSTEEYARVNAHFSELGLPMMFLDRIKPMFLSILASTDIGDMQGMLGGKSKDEAAMKSYELELNDIARDADKKVGGLETSAFQMSLFDSIPYRAQAQMLMDAIDNPTEGNSALDELTKIYVTGDIELMYTMTVGEEGGIGGFERMLVENRNRNWISPIKTSVMQGPALFAVGAAHLGGPTGVVNLLREAGFTLTPVSVR